MALQSGCAWRESGLVKNFTSKPVPICPIGTFGTFFAIRVVDPFFVGAAHDSVGNHHGFDGMTEEQVIDHFIDFSICADIS
jgi:hypothetical protein